MDGSILLAEPGQVLLSNVGLELCEGKTLELTPMSEATLKTVAYYQGAPE